MFFLKSYLSRTSREETKGFTDAGKKNRWLKEQRRGEQTMEEGDPDSVLLKMRPQTCNLCRVSSPLRKLRKLKAITSETEQQFHIPCSDCRAGHPDHRGLDKVTGEQESAPVTLWKAHSSAVCNKPPTHGRRHATSHIWRSFDLRYRLKRLPAQ